MNPNTSESNALYLQSMKEEYIEYLVKNGFNRSDLESLSLQELKKMTNAKLEEKYKRDEKEYNNSGGGKSKRKHRRGKRKGSRGKRKGSRRHKTRRHSKK